MKQYAQLTPGQRYRIETLLAAAAERHPRAQTVQRRESARVHETDGRQERPGAGLERSGRGARPLRGAAGAPLDRMG